MIRIAVVFACLMLAGCPAPPGSRSDDYEAQKNAGDFDYYVNVRTDDLTDVDKLPPLTYTVVVITNNSRASVTLTGYRSKELCMRVAQSLPYKPLISHAYCVPVQ